MIACKKVFYASLLAALGATAACSVQTDQQGDPNASVTDVVVVGTSVTSALYATGDLGLTLIPKDVGGAVVVGDGLHVSVTITSPASLVTTVGSTQCSAPEAGDQKLNVGVILDDSGSMASSDPNHERKTATITFLNALGAGDQVLLTDYGFTGDDLRDLLCVSQAGPNGDTSSCSPPKGAFSSDKTALIKATDAIDDGGGTPLFESCVAMVPLVNGQTDGKRGMLLLSDGAPNSDDQRDACHNAAKAAQLPVYTVGLGPAAEGDPNVDPDAVKVLRELASDTGGSYASANDPTQLNNLFANMGTALAHGSCQTKATVANASSIVPGTKITGEVTVGDHGAKATFELIAPSM